MPSADRPCRPTSGSATPCTTEKGIDAMHTVKVHVFKECNLRTGGRGVPPRPHEPDNVMFRIQPGMYEAYYQCAGPQAQEGDDRNFWWVLIKVAQEAGWVSAICI